MSGPGIAYLQTPARIVNEALDALARPEKAIGDLSDGTAIAEAARRNYGQLLRQLLRTAHWNFARKQAPLTLLADATGATPNVSTSVEQGWTYAYAWPIDGMAARWLPSSPPTSTATVLTGSPALFPPIPQMPNRFLVSSSDLYPVEVGQLPWMQMPDLQRTQGVGPVSRRIILTDAVNALFVYTRLVTAIEEWDSLFRQAMVALLALTLAPVAVEDPKERLALRNALIAAAKMTIADARVANGNDAGYPQSTDHTPLWISARSSGWRGSDGNSLGLSGWTYYPY